MANIKSMLDSFFLGIAVYIRFLLDSFFDYCGLHEVYVRQFFSYCDLHKVYVRRYCEFCVQNTIVPRVFFLVHGKLVYLCYSLSFSYMP